LDKLVAILGVIHRVLAATPEHYVFCYLAVAHISTHLVNLAFGPELGFTNKCRFGPGSDSGRVRAS